MKEFAEKSGFCGCFRASAKSGKNISEAFECLICNILERIKNMESKGEKVFEKERKNSLTLDPLANNEPPATRKKLETKESNDDIKKGSFEEHEYKDATKYCYECQLYLCDKYADYHKGLLKNHKIVTLSEINNEIFTGLCKEKNHNIKLDYYCKTHNKLCCGLCICKIKGNGNGQHNDCDICLIKDIKEEKKSKIKNNIKELEKLIDQLEQLEKKVKVIPEEVKENKDKLKSEIKNIFEKIRIELNYRENILSSEVDKYFEENYSNEGIAKKFFEIKSSLENVESIDDDWENDDKLNELINNSINIENNIKEINEINENIKKCNDSKYLKINIREKELNKIIEMIKIFGKIYISGIIFNNSLIIKNNNIYIDNLKTWINPEQNFKTELLYRKSKDGDNYETFHRLCDNKGPTLVLIQSNEGFIIGGYTPLNWDDKSGWIKDNEKIGRAHV